MYGPFRPRYAYKSISLNQIFHHSMVSCLRILYVDSEGVAQLCNAEMELPAMEPQDTTEKTTRSKIQRP